MKKKFILILLVIVICYGFLWYIKNSGTKTFVEANSKSTAKIINDDYATLKIDLSSLTSKGANSTLINDSDDVIYYDSAWILEKKMDNVWYSLKMNNEITYGFGVTKLDAKKSITFTINWQFWFGELSPGKYRVIKTFYTSDDNYEWKEKFYDIDYNEVNTTSVEFDIK